MKIAAIWARVSSPGQEDPSLDGQVNEVKPWLEKEGWIVPDNKIIKVVWGSLEVLTCPQIEVLLDWARKGLIEAVGLWHIDRLSGEPADKLSIVKELRRFNVKILSKHSPVLEGTEGELWDFLTAWEKKRQVLNCRTGTKRGLADRARLKGLPPTKTQVYGYKWENGKYIPDENHRNACLIFQLWFEKYKINYIRSELFKRGIPSSRHKTLWPDSSIRDLLKNPIYAGRVATLRYEKVEPKQRRKQKSGKTSHRIKPENEWHYLDGLVESPIITWEQHITTRERLKLNKQYARRNAKRNYLLRGLIECQLCHRHYYGVVPSSGKPKYVCSNSWGQPKYDRKCHARPIDQEEIETLVKTKIRNFLENPMVFSTEAGNRLSLQEETKGKVERGIRDLEKEYRNTIDEERRLVRKLSDEAFKAEQSLLSGKRTWLKDEMERQKEKLANLEKHMVTAETIESMKHRLHYNLDTATDDDWRLILESLGAKIIAFGDGHWDIEINVPVPKESTLIANKIGWCTFPC